MTKQTASSTIWQRFLKLLSSPAWNGLSCFLTAIGTFGAGSFIISYLLGFFKHVPDLFNWLLLPVELPTFVLIIGVIALLSFVSTSIYSYFSTRFKQRKQENIIPSPAVHPNLFEPSELDIQIMVFLADIRENGDHWPITNGIASIYNLTVNRADYSLRNLEKYGYINHNLDSEWGILDKGIDYLIEHQHI
jgi:hypothetical protein